MLVTPPIMTTERLGLTSTKLTENNQMEINLKINVLTHPNCSVSNSLLVSHWGQNKFTLDILISLQFNKILKKRLGSSLTYLWMFYKIFYTKELSLKESVKNVFL